MINDKLGVDYVVKLSKDVTFKSEVAQIRAKALLKEISPETVPPKWTYITSRVVRNVTAATFSLETLSETDSEQLKSLGLAARQFARTWEGLARLSEGMDRETAFMNAAVAYELAGYQANASCLARQFGRKIYEIDKPTVSELASTFLQRLFLQAIVLADRLLEEPDVSKSAFDQILGSIAMAIAGEGFAMASKYFLSGNNEILGQAHRSFKDAERNFASLGCIVESNLVRSIRSLLPVMQQRSTWAILSDEVKDNHRWRRYLRLLARGTGVDILGSPSVSELWPSQISALENGLLKSEASKVIKMPTSAGKTRVAELAIVHTLVANPGAKCVYIAPYRALVWELEQAFLSLFGDLGYRVSSVIGTYESDNFEELLFNNADILVMTPEKLDLLQRAQPEFLNNVRLFVLDEGQIVNDQRRGIKFELLLTRLKRRLPKARFLFLSAVVPQETLEDFAHWFHANPKDDVLITDWRPSIQRYAKFEWKGENGVISYVPSEDVELPKEFVYGVVKQQRYEFINPKTGRRNRRLFPQINHKSQTAAELAFKFAELGPVLIFCSQPNFVSTVARALERRLDLAKIRGDHIPSYFESTSETRSALAAKEWLGDRHPVTKFLSRGIAVHHGNLPDAVRKSVEVDFRDRRFLVLIATNTLAQGVNLPIRTVIVHSCWRRRAEDDLPEQIPARDYWNIAGRAGRAGRETEGTIIHIVTRPSDERDFQYYLQLQNKVEEVQSALFQLLLKLTFERLSESALNESLDPETLALLVEEGVESLADEAIDAILSETLVQTQARRYEFETKGLRKAFQNTAEIIKTNVADKSYWPVYSSTGLSSKSCEMLRTYIATNKQIVRDLLTSASPEFTRELATIFLDACQGLPEMRIAQEFGGSYDELLERWLSGADINEIIEEFENEAASSEELASLIEELFQFRLPWGISALIRIAMKELNLETDDLSEFAVFFPTMVKFGVPVPVASWALSAGVPFRQTGIKFAAKYLEETTNPNFQNFIEWLGKVNSEDLRHTFGLEGTALQDVSKALSRSGFNALLKDFPSCEEVLPRDTYVRGISYENRVVVAASARGGDSVELVRDYDNRVDHNAVKVQLHGQTLGYLERDLAQIVAPDMDCGVSLRGTIVNIERSRTPQIMIRVKIA